MNTVTLEQIQQLWPSWREGDRRRFEVFVLGLSSRHASRKTFQRREFLTIAVDRWLACLCPLFDESKRFYICKELLQSVSFREHAAKLGKDEDVEGFHLSVFEDRWVGWSGYEHLLDINRFEKKTALPRPHVWVIILGITPLYFRFAADLEQMEDASRTNQQTTNQTANAPQ